MQRVEHWWNQEWASANREDLYVFVDEKGHVLVQLRAGGKEIEATFADLEHARPTIAAQTSVGAWRLFTSAASSR